MSAKRDSRHSVGRVEGSTYKDGGAKGKSPVIQLITKGRMDGTPHRYEGGMHRPTEKKH